MPTYGFASTSLWRFTLAERDPDPDAEHREYLRSTFLRARETTGALLGELGGSVPEYTVHDLTHADALWETASLLLGGQVTVNPAEGFVLGLAFLLHDAAMGRAAYQGGPQDVLGPEGWRDLLCAVFRDREGRWPEEDELAEPPARVVAAARLAAVREAHARQAAVLVETPWTSAEGTPYFLLDDARLRDWYGPLLADLVESHWWDVDRVSAHFRRDRGSPPWLPDWPLDPLKLACLLRLADATQVDARRAPTLLFLLRRPEGESARHWRFQQYVNRPQPQGDRITYTSSRPFAEADAAAWWLALDYLRSVDAELRKVDDLMHDLNRPRFAARGVTGVGTPSRFAELFGVRGWRPVDADVRISDVHGLVAALGGEQLYGRQPEVAVRELIQNAQDAVLARRVLEPGFEGTIEVALAERAAGEWVLEVRDDGIGMDEELLVRGLLDFGRSTWRTPLVRRKFTGLMGAGFRPTGRFGIGFFSVFMLGDEVEVVTRRFDLAGADARRLFFHGLAERALVAPVPPADRAPVGTVVRVRLRDDPFLRDGLLNSAEDKRLDWLVSSLVPESKVLIRCLDLGSSAVELPPFVLAMADPGAVFDRLYPPPDERHDRSRRRHQAARGRFTELASEFVDPEGRRVGLAVLAGGMSSLGFVDHLGLTTLGGFRADKVSDFVGYVEGSPGRASRDRTELAVSDQMIGDWCSAQRLRLQSSGRWTPSRQLRMAGLLVRAGLAVDPDHHVAVGREGSMPLDRLVPWAGARDVVLLHEDESVLWVPYGDWHGQLIDTESGEPVELPDEWVVPAEDETPYLFDQVLDDRRDAAYAESPADSWQERWYDLSGEVTGLVLRRIAAAWSCTIEDLLRPCEERAWADTATYRTRTREVYEADVLRLERPAR